MVFWGKYANGLTSQSFGLRMPKSRWVTGVDQYDPTLSIENPGVYLVN
jgi:hypothetical protein